MRKKSFVSVNVLSYNSRKYLKKCFDSILSQTYKKIEIVLIDNASTDGSVYFVRSEYPDIKLLSNDSNEGYSRAHNKGIRNCSGEYILVLNPDVMLEPDFIKELVKAIESNDDVGIVNGKIYLMNDDGTPLGNAVLDACGLGINKYRKNYERGHNEVDIGQYDKTEHIFGGFGAATLYRAGMLEDVNILDEYFDEDFFMYREDVDIAWRAQLLGWKSIFTPYAIAYHIHSYTPEKRDSMPKYSRILQFRNRYLMIVKNELASNILFHIHNIFIYEIMALSYVLIKEQFLFEGYRDALRLARKMLIKRKLIMKKRKATSRDMLQFFQ